MTSFLLVPLSQSDMLRTGTIVTVADATFWYHCNSLTCYILVLLSQSSMPCTGIILTV
ncbi:hypothetical protein DPMN_028216 [Dreissena polymorpha]|uniref:Uncharacterized protein n=1 Tax=Dreissena polymorpha TaxID=45954 RepID=A0A9D4LUB1_DREPO|nr:hypothetical protein DPMN_028216 [Dreissena polymorpha]